MSVQKKGRPRQLDVIRLRRTLNLNVLPWDGHFIVHEFSEEDRLCKPYFAIFQRDDGYRIHLYGLWFYDLKEGLNEYWSLSSERLKRLGTLYGCFRWIARFNALTTADQLSWLEHRRIEFRDPHVVKVQNHKGWRVVSNHESANPRAHIIFIGKFHY